MKKACVVGNCAVKCRLQLDYTLKYIFLGTKVIASGNISKGVPASSLIQMGNLEFVLSGKFLLRSKLDMGQPLKESTSCKIVLGLEDQGMTLIHIKLHSPKHSHQ